MSEEEYDFRHELSNVPWVGEYSFNFEYLLNKQTCRLSLYQMLNIVTGKPQYLGWIRYRLFFFILMYIETIHFIFDTLQYPSNIFSYRNIFGSQGL